MVGPPSILSSSSATPTQKTLLPQHPVLYGSSATRSISEREGLHPAPYGNNARTLSSNSMASYARRGSSLAPSPAAPGSFSANIRNQPPISRAGSGQDMIPKVSMERLGDDGAKTTEQVVTSLRESLNRELKIKEGSENMLEALNTKKAKQTKEQRQKVEAELNSSTQKIRELKQQITEMQRVRVPTTPTTRSRMNSLFQTTGGRSPQNATKVAAESEEDETIESPTYALAELLQALEVEGMTPDYYVGHANNLVALFKRQPTLKHDLVWSVFGLRMQVMLLSESREVVAAGYRMIRYAITDLASLQTIRRLNTDYLVILSLIKERKADVEREQALKFVRAFLEIKGGVGEISRGIVRTIASVAEHGEDRLRSMCVETLAEIVVRDTALVVESGGLRPLADALGEGTYEASESLTSAYLFLFDTPERRKYLRAGYELEVLFTPFTDSLFAKESLLKQNSRAIAYAMRTWPGLMTLSMYNFRAIRSLTSCLMFPNLSIRETVIDLLYGLLRIKSPFWATSFLAGRRLTTYGRVAPVKAAPVKTVPVTEDEAGDKSFVDHYTALTLAVLISSDMLPGLLHVTRTAENPTLKRKTTLLIGEVLKLASNLLPTSWSSDLQLLPELFTAASKFEGEDRFDATGTVYQISSVSRTLHRTAAPVTLPNAANNSDENLAAMDDQPKLGPSIALDEPSFRNMIVDSQVLAHTNPMKWKWDVILKIIEGPLLNGKRLDEAIKASKFIKRLTSFYRPFKYNFSEMRITRVTQNYIKVGCALLHTLLQTPEGIKYLSDNKLLRQIAECIAQCDPKSGLTAVSPMFSRERLSETLCYGYFAMIGTMAGDVKGLQMIQKWKMFNMMFSILIEDKGNRPDLIKILLSNFDYSLQGHPRIILSQALTSGSKEIRIHSTNILRRYTSKVRPKGVGNQGVGDSKWAIQLLVTQLYDPEVEVCATAIKILEEACNRKAHLEYIVECRPSLDHLGEIGAPLLLRFLSTSIGYHYLDGLDYISNEMDDWFLGRNDSYVAVIEASLARSFIEIPEDPSRRLSITTSFEMEGDNDVQIPPHFYKELTRTAEGCKLLRNKGHFDEFASIIRDYGMAHDDPEMLLTVKGALWAVGNVGSMERGAPFIGESDVVENIIMIAESHEVMTLRGTAFFVLGLISRSVLGLEILSEHGWDSITTAMGTSLGLCIPQDLGKFLSYKPWKHESVLKTMMSPTKQAASAIAKQDDNFVNQRILEHVIELGNTVLQKRAMTELNHIKSRKVNGFKQPALFKKVMVLLEAHHFKLTVRRFVIDLFDRSVMRQIVLEEESDEEEEDDDEELEESESDDSESEGTTARQRSVSNASPPIPE